MEPEDFGEILFKFDVLYSGWEVDSEGYVVRDKEGRNQLVLSNHGTWAIAQPSELQERIDAYHTAINNSRQAIEMVQPSRKAYPVQRGPLEGPIERMQREEEERRRG